MTHQSDTLFINDLSIPCIIGVYDYERKEKQMLHISLALTVDTIKAGQTDEIKDTVSYHDIANDVVTLVETSQYHLLEKLAHVVAKK